MNLLDENFPEDQLPLLRQWRIPFRQLGKDLAYPGIKDYDIIPWLHRVRRVTLFTQDQDFFRFRFCHPAYGLVWLDVSADETAFYTRRTLRHPRFNTVAKRMGCVVHIRLGGIKFWRFNHTSLQAAKWPGG